MVVIPKHLHFIFGMTPTDKQWSLVHHVCVRSAIEKIKPDDVSFYTQYEPSGPWWDLTRPLVNLRPIVAPSEVFGRPVDHPAHRADVVRLRQLKAEGGIYLDVDVMVHRDFDDLLGNSVVLGREGEGAKAVGLCNAVILAEREAPFIDKWYENYRDFSPKHWSLHSVGRPLKLSREFPDELTILGPRAFFWPLWTHEHVYLMFGSPRMRDLRGDYANHLWERNAWDYLDRLDVGHVRNVDSVFHGWARPYLEGLPDDYGGGVGSLHGLRRDIYSRARSQFYIHGSRARRLFRSLTKR